MRRTILTTCFTLMCGAALLSAQTPSQSSSTATQSSTSSSRTSTETRSTGSVTLTGCLQAGTEPNTFVLNHVSETGTQTGSQRSTADKNPSEMARADTTYSLVPNNKKIDFSKHMGHRVEVSGNLMPEGSSHSGSSKDSSASSSSSSSTGQMGSMDSGRMQLKVRSIRQVAATCP